MRSHTAGVDYLNDRLLSSYFEAREHETYYRSLKHVNSRRDFHETIGPVLMDFIGETLSARDTLDLDAVLASTAERRSGQPALTDPAEEAKRRHRAGFDLLLIGEVLNFETLKSSYRRAALCCHPDKGGSHEKMVLVNEAYSLFHEILCRNQLATSGDGHVGGLVTDFDVPVTKAEDFLYVLGLMLLGIKIDDWALDDAHYWVTILTSDEWVESEYARHPRTRANLLFPCSTLAGRLWGAGLRDQAQEVYKAAEDSFRVAQGNALYQGNGLSEADAYIKGGQKLRLVLNHRRQADNALRLGLIDQKRHNQTVERLGGKKDQANGQAETLRRLLSKGGFLPNLPTDRGAKGKVVRSRLVPEPGYFEERVENLTDDQQAEYLRAFGPGADIGLVGKYTHVRLTSLLRSIILHDGDVELPAIERECEGLAEILPNSGSHFANRVAEIARFLGGLGQADRKVRCDLLHQLDEKAADATTITLQLQSGEVEQTDSTFRVRLNPDYLDTVQLPTERLRLAVRTGSAQTEAEKAEKNATWNRDMGLINSPKVKDSQCAVFEAGDTAKDDTERFIRVVQPHCELLLELGKSMVHVDQLQVGYYLDRLTVALTRLKKWEEAKRWLDLYFGLPERYRGRSSPSEQEAMRKRLEKCVKQLSR